MWILLSNIPPYILSFFLLLQRIQKISFNGYCWASPGRNLDMDLLCHKNMHLCLYQVSPNCCPKWLSQFCTPIIYVGIPTSWPKLGNFGLHNIHQPDEDKMVS